MCVTYLLLYSREECNATFSKMVSFFKFNPNPNVAIFGLTSGFFFLFFRAVCDKICFNPPENW